MWEAVDEKLLIFVCPMTKKTKNNLQAGEHKNGFQTALTVAGCSVRIIFMEVHNLYVFIMSEMM